MQSIYFRRHTWKPFISLLFLIGFDHALILAHL